MSNDMKREQEQARKQKAERELKQAYSQASEEQTSPELDASIMAMAQKEVDSQNDTQSSWWQRLRMPVSIAAALVVTVGIARVMVELGYYHPDTIAQSENQPQAYDSATEIVLADEAFKERAAEEKASEVAVATAKRQKQRAELEARQAESETIIVTGARISAENREQAYQQAVAERRQAEPMKMETVTQEEAVPVASAPVEKADKEQENQEVESSYDKLSGQRSAVDIPYLPAEEWLESIAQLLDAEKNEEAKVQWTKFKRVYPDYVIEKPMLQRLEAL